MLTSIGSPAAWIGFFVLVLVFLALDLGVFHRKAHEVSLREAGVWSAIWVALSLGFAGALHVFAGPDRALEFVTGYVIEKALSVDNLFVFVVVFSTFAIPAAYQHRILFWGVLGALVLRAVFVFAGTAFIQRFDWALYAFGALLAITGVKLLFQGDEPPKPEENPVVKAVQRVLPLANELDGERFTLVKNGRRYGTRLLLALVVVEITDVVFAVDSIPAIFGVTTDPFVVLTSNVFAIFGLRSLYFLLAGVVQKLVYLKFGLSTVLVFVGGKMLASGWFHVPILVSLAVITGILGTTVAASLLRPAATGSPAGPAA